MRLPIKYEILFREREIQTTIDFKFHLFKAVYRRYIYQFYAKGTSSKGNTLARRLNIHLKTKGINAIEVEDDDDGFNGVGWFLPQYEEVTKMLFLEFKVLEQGRATPRQLYTEVNKCLAYITEYIFKEMFSPYSFPYRLMSGIDTYRDILSNMTPIGDEDFSDDFSFEGIARGYVRFAYYEIWDNNRAPESRPTLHIKF